MGWTIVVTNNGPSPVTNASVTDTFDAAFLSRRGRARRAAARAVPRRRAAATSSTTVTLLAGGTATFTITGLVDPVGDSAEQHRVVWPPADTTDPLTRQQQSDERVTVIASRRFADDQDRSGHGATGHDDQLHDHGHQRRPCFGDVGRRRRPDAGGLDVCMANAGACTTPFPCALGTLAPGETAHDHRDLQVTTTRWPATLIAQHGDRDQQRRARCRAGEQHRRPSTTEIRRLTSCDMNGDGIEEFVTGAGPGGGPHVRAWSVDGTASPASSPASSPTTRPSRRRHRRVP